MDATQWNGMEWNGMQHPLAPKLTNSTASQPNESNQELSGFQLIHSPSLSSSLLFTSLLFSSPLFVVEEFELINCQLSRSKGPKRNQMRRDETRSRSRSRIMHIMRQSSNANKSTYTIFSSFSFPFPFPFPPLLHRLSLLFSSLFFFFFSRFVSFRFPFSLSSQTTTTG